LRRRRRCAPPRELRSGDPFSDAELTGQRRSARLLVALEREELL